MASVQSVYLALPRAVQEFLITAYGMKEYRARYLYGLSDPYLTLFEDNVTDLKRVHDWQKERFAHVVAHAAHHVPFYRRLFSRLGVRAGEVTLDNFQDVIPILEKAEVIADPSSFVSECAPQDSIKLFTSGTSGSPMPIVCSREARALNYAFFRQMLRALGCDVRDRSATFAGRILFSEGESEIFWRRDFFNRSLMMSSYRLSDYTMPLYIKALEAWQPVYIDSYPSAIAEIARYIVEKRVRHTIRPKLVLTSSETLTEVQRDHIASAFGAEILDHYGCTEMAVSAYSTHDGRYRVEPLYSIVEFDAHPDGENASLICTGLLNKAMPLLRYKIGDAVSGSRSNTNYRYADQTFAKIVGREDDLIITPDGRKIGRLDPAFKGLSGIKQAQIVQNEVSKLEVLVVQTENADSAAIASLLSENLRARTSQEMVVDVKFVQSIPLTRSGKFKSVVSNLRPGK